MALSIKTEEADRLARRLANLTGETMTEAVTIALRERLERQEASQAVEENLPAQLAELARSFEFDRSPVSKAEWDWASGDED